MPSTVEDKEGAIDSFYDANSGKVTELNVTEKHDFYHPSANVEFIIGDGVTYRKITTPTGNVIITNVKKKV
jgi:hypothetical protein